MGSDSKLPASLHATFLAAYMGSDAMEGGGRGGVGSDAGDAGVEDVAAYAPWHQPQQQRQQQQAPTPPPQPQPQPHHQQHDRWEPQQQHQPLMGPHMPPLKRFLHQGKGVVGREAGPDDKKEEGELWCSVEAQAAFLGPNLWDKTLPYDADLKYVDLDEFLSENGIPVDTVGSGLAQPQPPHHPQHHGGAAPAPGGPQQPPPVPPQAPQQATTGPGGGAVPQPPPPPQGPPGLGGVGGVKVATVPTTRLAATPTDPSLASASVLELVAKRERSPSPEPLSPVDGLNPPSPAESTLSLASSGRDFDPRTRAFSDEELKPQPMIKKSRKQDFLSLCPQFVPDNMKDEKYWARRRKNNMAAKRSRDARRVKENQIALRAGFLEKENMGLRQELDRLKKENMLLRDKLAKFTDV